MIDSVSTCTPSGAALITEALLTAAHLVGADRSARYRQAADEALRAQAVAALENVEGVTGKISYAGTQGMPLRSVSLVRIEGGNRSLVSQGVPAAEDVPAP